MNIYNLVVLLSNGKEYQSNIAFYTYEEAKERMQRLLKQETAVYIGGQRIDPSEIRAYDITETYIELVLDK